MAESEKESRRWAIAALQEACKRLDHLASKNTGEIQVGLFGAMTHIGLLADEIEDGRWSVPPAVQKKGGSKP